MGDVKTFSLPHKAKAKEFAELEIHKIENAESYSSDDEIKRDSTKKKSSTIMDKYNLHLVTANNS